jgi:cytochrome c biogenesis protein CcmG/thiol:disulfide interchange protein DsbE
MSPIRFIAVRADKLATVVVISLILLGLIGYISFLNVALRRATPVPRALLTLSIPAATASAPPPSPAVVGQKAPEFTLPDATGRSVTLLSYMGKPVVLYFWATWCSFCRTDMPQLQHLAEEYTESGLTILAINLLEKDAVVKSFAKQLNLQLPLLLDTDGQVSAAYTVRATPTYMFIDKQGVLQAQIVGRPRTAVLARNLALILELPQDDVKLTPTGTEEAQDETRSPESNVQEHGATPQAPNPNPLSP